MCRWPGSSATPAERSATFRLSTSGCHTRRGLTATELIDLVVQAFFAPALHLELIALCQPLELLDQYLSVDEECPPSLVTTETVKQFDRPTAPQSKQALDDGPVNHGHNEGLQERHYV